MVSSSSAALIFAVVGSQLLQGRLVVVGADWVKMSSFCNAVDPKLSSNQAKRDYILGSNAWRIGLGKGTTLVHNTYWDNKAGSRGGGAPLAVERNPLELAFYNYYVR